MYIDVPVGTLQMLAGSRAQISLNARSGRWRADADVGDLRFRWAIAAGGPKSQVTDICVRLAIVGAGVQADLGAASGQHLQRADGYVDIHAALAGGRDQTGVIAERIGLDRCRRAESRAVAPPSRLSAAASIETDPFGDYARLVTPAGEGRVYIDVPVGTLQMLAGSRAQISLNARSDDGEPTQMSVTCDFGPPRRPQSPSGPKSQVTDICVGSPSSERAFRLIWARLPASICSVPTGTSIYTRPSPAGVTKRA